MQFFFNASKGEVGSKNKIVLTIHSIVTLKLYFSSRLV